MKISPTSGRLLVWKGLISKIKINQNLNQRMKTIVRRKTDPARREDLPWPIFDSSTGTQNTSDIKRISLSEMSISRISFIQHMHGNLQGKTGPEVGSDI